MIDTVIFDMDGVIVDSERHWKEFNFIKSLVPSWNEEHHKKILGLDFTLMHKLLKEDFNANINEKELLDFYRNLALDIYKNRASLMPGFSELLTALKKENFKTAVASASPKEWIDIVIKRFKLSALFDEITSCYGANFKGKPYPDIYLHTAKQLGKRPEQCIVIEDSMNGVTAAKSAGMKCIGLRNGFNNHQDLSQADVVIKTFSEFSVSTIKEL